MTTQVDLKCDKDISGYEAVLFANKLFYRAFADASMAGMYHIWANDRDDVSVIHPGSAPITGRENVLETWQAIFDDASGVDVDCEEAKARIYGDVAIVLCRETVHGHSLSVTNVFCRALDGWRIVHHQAGPGVLTSWQKGFDRPLAH